MVASSGSQNHLSSPSLPPRMGKSLAAEIVQARSEQGLVVPDTWPRPSSCPVWSSSSLPCASRATRPPAKLNARHMHTLFGPSYQYAGSPASGTAARLLTVVTHKAIELAAHLAAYAGLHQAPDARTLLLVANTHVGGARGVLKRMCFLSILALRVPISRGYYARKV